MSDPDKINGRCTKLPYEVNPGSVKWMQEYFAKHPEAKFIPSKEVPGIHKKAAESVRGQLEDHFKGASRADLARFIEVGSHYCDWQQAMGQEWQVVSKALIQDIAQKVPELKGKVSLVPERDYNQWVVRLEVKGQMAHNDPRLRDLQRTVLGYFQQRLNGSDQAPLRYLVKWNVAGDWKDSRASLLLLPLSFLGTSSQYGNGDGFDGRGTAASTPGLTLMFSQYHLTAAQRYGATGTVNFCQGPTGGTICIKNDKGPYGVPREFDVTPTVAQKVDGAHGYFPMKMSVFGMDGKNFTDQTMVFPGIGTFTTPTTLDDKGHVLLAVFPQAINPILLMAQLPPVLQQNFRSQEINSNGQVFNVIVSSQEMVRPKDFNSVIKKIHDISGLRPGWISTGQLYARQ